MIYPEKLKRGDIIGITAVSCSANLETIDDAINNINKLGFSTYETANVRTGNTLVSSSGKQRADEFMELWSNSKIKHIISARGGEVLFEMLPYLHDRSKEIKRSIPKFVQGFSDTSLLLYYLTTNYNIATVHAENIGDFAMKNLDEALMTTINIIQSKEDIIQENFSMYEDGYVEKEEFNSYILTKEVIYKSLYGRNEENIKGRLIGGCIDAIKMLLGTKFDKTTEFCSKYKEGMLWYFDNCELNIIELYRVISQLKEAGWFTNANGFIFGRTNVEKTRKVDNGEVTYEDMLKRALEDLKVPVVYDVDIGHQAPQFTIINGALGEFIYKDKKGKLIQKLV